MFQFAHVDFTRKKEPIFVDLDSGYHITVGNTGQKVRIVYYHSQVSQWRGQAFLLLAGSLAFLAKYHVADLHVEESVEAVGVGLDAVQRLSFVVQGHYSDRQTQGAGYRQADVGVQGLLPQISYLSNSRLKETEKGPESTFEHFCLHSELTRPSSPCMPYDVPLHQLNIIILRSPVKNGKIPKCLRYNNPDTVADFCG